jgi:hypothetical protein
MNSIAKVDDNFTPCTELNKTKKLDNQFAMEDEQATVKSRLRSVLQSSNPAQEEHDSPHATTSCSSRSKTERQSSHRCGNTSHGELIQSVLESFSAGSSLQTQAVATPRRKVERQRSERRGAFAHFDLLESAVEASFQNISCYGSDPEDTPPERNNVHSGSSSQVATITPITTRPTKRPRLTHAPIQHFNLNGTNASTVDVGINISDAARCLRPVSR